MLHGSGTYYTPNGKKSIGQSNIFVFTSNEPHYITQIGQEGLSILNLHFSNSVTKRNPLLNEKYPFIFYNHSEKFDNRIEKAKRMLDKSERSLNILDIAIQCGYSNTANFNRAFKQHTGITPSQYRNSNYIDLV